MKKEQVKHIGEYDMLQVFDIKKKYKLNKDEYFLFSPEKVEVLRKWK